MLKNCLCKYSKKYPPKAPAAKLAILAVLKNKQRQGFGTLMMVNAIERIILVSKNLGIIRFFVDAKNEEAKVITNSLVSSLFRKIL